MLSHPGGDARENQVMGDAMGTQILAAIASSKKTPEGTSICNAIGLTLLKV